MEKLQKAINAESYEFLAAHQPEILSALEHEVGAGRTPEQIRLYVIRETGREELALRCKQAAQHIMTITVVR